MSFNKILNKYRDIAFSERDKGDRFELLMQRFLLTDATYANKFKNVWMWNEFFAKDNLGGNDTGIDLVAQTIEGDFWAIQCKCYKEGTTIDKKAVDSFITTSGRSFKNEQLQTTRFAHRLWIDTTGKPFGKNAEEAIHGQDIPVTRIGLAYLQDAQVDWDKLDGGIWGEQSRTPKKTLRPHQTEALNNTHEVFKTADRGKLIMACGTGKTFTALRIAENETNGKGLVLFLVPSIALLGQTLREWSADAKEKINAVCICSDPEISRQKKKKDDTSEISIIDLALPASTDTTNILNQFEFIKRSKNEGMTVVFSTYQSIEVIAKAQQAMQVVDPQSGIFDLIICDEAHRTTGVTLASEDESAFVKVHDNSFLQARKRLYMTATPRLYSDDSKSKAALNDAVLCSMDDEETYGQEIYRIGFGEAVEKNLLTDYKVLILTLSDQDVPQSVQAMVADDSKEINADDASKLIGCINALSKQVLGDEGIIKDSDPDPMKRAVAFCQSIKISSAISDSFNETTEKYVSELPQEKQEQMVSIHSKHIDGTMTAPERDELLGWLKADSDETRILTNVRCLSEGVDVPSLDAVMFLSARNSEVDVVQSVGRVMRRAEGKKYGYIIIPVVVPSDVEASKALDNNERYKVVWTVLNALRAHDDRFNATVNKIELNRKKPSNILVGRPDFTFDDNGNPVSIDNTQKSNNEELNRQLQMQFEQLQSVVFARMVKKVGDRRYWEQWAKSVAEIAQRQIERITVLVHQNGEHKITFEKFLLGLQKNINTSITEQQAIEMLSQHIITKPVFEALFEGYSFVKSNPISHSMQDMLNLLEANAIEKDLETLQKFYDSVRRRAEGIDNAEGKQKIIVELYDKFFKTAFPKMVEQLGIVYTPVEVVDFIIHSVNHVLQKEFGRNISEENVHILDPFTGTGTFITRLLQSGLIKEEDLDRKYKYELHANEIVLLAYYIATVNIENAYHDATPDPDDGIGKDKYFPFEGICLTDTFQLGEIEDGVLFSEMFPQNSERLEAQKKGPIRVIMGNPPYSVGQKSENDNAQNQKYPILESRIKNTYAKNDEAISVKDLYDSYIKAFRWASDRLKENGGVIGFITNSGWLDKGFAQGFRDTLTKEFSSIYILNLRGAIKGRIGEGAKKEGGNIFDILTGVAITILVQKKDNTENTSIYYYDIGDYKSKNDKLKFLKEFKDINNISLQKIIPNQYGDWLNLRSDVFQDLIPLVPDKKFNHNTKSFFVLNSLGINTNRDSWVYNYSLKDLVKNVNITIDFYNEQLIKAKDVSKNKLKQSISFDATKISWSSSLLSHLERGNSVLYNENSICISLYRPFNKRNLYFGDKMIHRRGQFDQLFPTINHKNIIILTPGKSERRSYATLIIDTKADLNIFDGGVQALPLYYYEENQNEQKSLFDTDSNDKYIRRDGVSDFIFQRAIKQYGKSVNKEDIFYYVYGILHSPDYRETFANDLKKMLPRIPLVDKPKDFWAFSKAGRQLADLHINYESVEPSKEVIVLYDRMPKEEIEKGMGGKSLESINYRVQKMRFPKKGQKDTIIYNSQIVIENIPEKAYEYVVNGKSAIDWIMERYQVTTDKKSGITNDPNDWSTEVGNPRYILDLLLSIINVSVQTVDIVNELPKLQFE